MMTKAIDVWDVETFDDGLTSELHANAELVRDYTAAERALDLDHKASRLAAALRSNPHDASYLRFVESLAERLEARTVRGWHYTRLTDSEVETLRMTGIHLSTLDAVRRRIDAQVVAGNISLETADALFRASPFHNCEQYESRANRFWVTSHPHEVDDDGVALLLANWGGEGVYFWQEEPHLQSAVSGIGRARVVEVAVPLDATRGSYWASKAIVATFARTLGCVQDFGAFDLCAIRPLRADAILAVHTEGEGAFDALGRGYPINYRAFET